MRTARITAQNTFSIMKESVPRIKEGEVLVKLKRAVICGSDFPYFYMKHPDAAYPLPAGYPGHESLGEVAESKSELFREGDIVMYYPTDLDSYKEYHANSASRLQKLPGGIDLNELVMTQLLGAVAHCAFRIDKPYNKTVAIAGQGPAGLLFTSLMKNFGAKKIITVDPLDYRLEVSKQMGADYTINPDSVNLEESIKEITNGAMVDIVIEVWGQNLRSINQCFDIACHNGLVAFFGISLEESPKLNFNKFFRKELRMISSVGPDLSIDYPYALDMIQRGAVDVKPLITHVLPFEEIQRGFEIAIGRLENAIKVVLTF